MPSFEVSTVGNGTCIVTIHQVRDEAGDILGYSILAIDITDRKAIEDALRVSEHRHRVAAALTPRISWRLDPQGQLLDVEEKMTRFGYESRRILGQEWADLVDPEQLPEVMAAVRHSLTTGAVYDRETRYILPDGELAWFHIYMSPERDADGNILCWYGQAEDIDLRKRSELALLAEREEFRFILEQSKVVHWRLSPDGRVHFITNDWERMTGRSAADTARNNDIDLIAEDQRDAVVAHWQHCIQYGHVFDMDYRIRMVDGVERWMRCRSVPRYDATGTILAWYGTMIEIAQPRPVGRRCDECGIDPKAVDY